MTPFLTAALLLAPLLAPPAPPAPADTIRVGSPALGSVTLTLGTDTVDMRSIQDGRSSPMIVYVEAVTEVEDGYLVVERNETPDGHLVTLDSIVLARGSLATLRHADVTPQGRRHVTFADGRARGFEVDSLGHETAIDRAVPPGLFDYSVMTLVSGHLAWRPGYEVVLATYDVARGEIYVPLRAVGEETLSLGGRDVRAWHVEVDFGDWTVSRWVDPDDGTELRWELERGGRTMIGERRGGDRGGRRSGQRIPVS